MAQGGVVRAILDWCTIFAERGHHVTLLTYGPDDLPKEWLAKTPGIPHAIIIPPPTLPGKLLGSQAKRVADEALQNADVLHLHGPWVDGNRQIANLARRRKLPYLVSTHGMLGDWGMLRRSTKKKLYLSLFGRRVLDHAAAIHCTAEAEWREASKWFNNRHKAILPYLVDLKAFENLPGPESGLSLLPANRRGEPRILYLGRLHEQKGVDLLIEAAALLAKMDTPFILMLAGNGEAQYERYLHNLTAKLNLQDRLFFLGLITGQQKISLYQCADLFVSPTRFENFGLVLIEALACGTPVVTTKGTNIWDEVQNADGIIADSTPQALATAIHDLLKKPEELPARGRQGRAWAFKALAVEPLARRYEDLYRKIAGGEEFAAK
jgi:glycosyltransferase involved in cell wall biosynthesis